MLCSTNFPHAKLTFGVWIALLRRPYEMTLWRPALHGAFPGYRGPRSTLHEDLRNMGLLRNRIAHHEPVHHRHLAAPSHHDYERTVS
jgi:hypothetical protein